MSSIITTPKADGFFMPAEFDRHYATVMVWPERPGSWSYGGAEARKAFEAVIRAISKSEKVFLAVSPTSRPSAQSQLADLIACGKVTLWDCVTDDAWARDIAPTCVKDANGNVRAVDWQFNAWGGEYNGLYKSWERDNAFAKFVCDSLGMVRYDASHFVCEGGSIHSDGEGTVMVTEECLLSKGRNPHLSKQQIENVLKEQLGAETVLWLPFGIFNDETDGHVDNVCAFTAPAEVVLAWTDDKDDPNYPRLKKNLDYLSAVRDAKGRPIKVRKLPLPDNPVRITEYDIAGLDCEEGEDEREAGERLASSYVNFYIANGCIVLPVFGDNKDAVAVEVLKSAFPSREIITVDAKAIIVGGGNVHCITQQITEGIYEKR